MFDKKHLRKRLFVDPKIQGALIVRVILYWMFCLMTIVMMLICWRVAAGPSQPFWIHLTDLWSYNGPALIASFVLLPLVEIDIVKLSNRFVGPLLRLRKSMRSLARGERVEPLEFRNNDFWREFADEFNAVLKFVKVHNAQLGEKHDREEELQTSAAR
jgi:hypothetical protein